MKVVLAALFSGALFGAGLAWSGMTNPARVIGFLDITGNWDPTLSLTNLNMVEPDDAPTEISTTPPHKQTQKKTALPPGVLSADAIAAYLDATLLEAQAQLKQINVLRFGLDDHSELTERFGNEVTQTIAARVARVLKDKIGQGDHIGCEDASRFIIASMDSSHASCTAFARRVCRGLANSQVTIAGETFNLKVSAGIVSTSRVSTSAWGWSAKASAI